MRRIGLDHPLKVRLIVRKDRALPVHAGTGSLAGKRLSASRAGNTASVRTTRSCESCIPIPWREVIAEHVSDDARTRLSHV
jgi:hypothetical protein